MAKAKAKEEALKKYIAKAVLVGNGVTHKVGDELELTDAQAERLLDLKLVELVAGQETQEEKQEETNPEE